jgi:predicted permease
MQALLQDLRYSIRQLIHSPGFAVTAVISLALGIGATTAVFSVVYATLVNPYPYPAAERIVRMTVRNSAGNILGINLNDPQIRLLRASPVIESMLAMDYHAMTMTGHDLPENVNVIGMIANGFEDLGMRTVRGRGLTPSDAIDGQEPQPAVVLSYKFWQTRFLGDPDVVGKTLQLDRKNFSVVGVVAPRFTWYMADVYVPMKLAHDPTHMCIVDFRLRPGVTHQAANAALEPLVQQFARDLPKRFPERFKVQVEGLNEWVERGISGTLYLLFGAVALLLAIGCGNVSILLLARGTARQHELGVRCAVGASGGRLLRQLLTESLLLAAAGVVPGVLAAYGILAGMRTVLPRYAFAPEVAVTLSLPVLIFSAGLAAATTVLFGLWPAWQLSRTQDGRLMVAGARRVLGTVRGRRMHSALLAVQIALTMVLLAGAGSAMDGFARLIRTPLGYDPHRVMSVGIPLHENTYTNWAARAAYFAQLRAKVADTPGIAMAAISSNATPPRSGWYTRFEILGRPLLEEQKASVQMVSPEYFSVLRIPLLTGRLWSEAETRNGSHVAVINRALERRYFPSGDAIGRSLKVPGFEDRPPAELSAPEIAASWLQVVGIAGDARNDGLAEPATPAIFVPYTLNMRMGTQILVRSEAPPLTLLHAVRLQLTAVDPDQQSYSNVEDLESWISDQPEWQRGRLVATLFGVFSGLALALAAVGLYSVVSYTVAQRINEFGIRMALGAGRGNVLRMVFVSTMKSVGGGLATGLVLAAASAKLVEKWSQGNARDPAILLAGAMVMILVSGAASALPALRASRVDPMTALRCE